MIFTNLLWNFRIKSIDVPKGEVLSLEGAVREGIRLTEIVYSTLAVRPNALSSRRVIFSILLSSPQPSIKVIIPVNFCSGYTESTAPVATGGVYSRGDHGAPLGADVKSAP